ncbi:MAG: cell wall hydrolase [Lachnospiraceae bacterium]|nr:cell wall hydrolase [Lachnospiraceae bacterium]
MKAKQGKTLEFLRALSFTTYFWCFGVIGVTFLLCMSFFVNEPAKREIIEFGRAVQGAETATDFDQTLYVRSISHENSIYDHPYDYASLSEHAITEEAGLISPDIIISSNGSASEQNESSQQNDGSLAAAEEIPLESAADKFTVERVNVNELPAQDDISLQCSVSIADYLALCQIVEAEAKSEDVYGKRLVANVVLNRMDSSRYPDDIEQVILDEGQFDPVENGIYYRTVPTEDAKYAVMTALNGEDDSQSALYFQRSASHYWGDKTYLFRYGSHSFYR